MKKKINYRKVVVVSLLLLMTVFLGFEITRKDEDVNLSNSEVVSKSTSIDNEQFGKWDMEVTVSAIGSNVNIDETSNKVSVNNVDNVLENNAFSINVSSKYHANTSQEGRPPQFLFNLSDLFMKNTELTYEPNYESNQIDIKKGMEIVGYLKFGSIPLCDLSLPPEECAVGSSPYLAGFMMDGDSNNVSIMGIQPIPTTDDYNSNFTLEYALSPSVMGLGNSRLSFNTTFDMVSITEVSTILCEFNLIRDTISLNNIEAKPEEVFETWDSSWGTEEIKYDRYAKYRLTGYVDYPKEYNIGFQIIGVPSGTLFAYSNDNKTYTPTTVDDFIANNTCNISKATNRSDVECSFIVGYNFDGKNKIPANFGVVANAKTDSNMSKNFSWSHEISNGVVEPEVPVGLNTNYDVKITPPFNVDSLYKNIQNGMMAMFEYSMSPTKSSLNSTGSTTVSGFNLWNLTNKGSIPYTFNFETNPSTFDTSSTKTDNEYKINDFTYANFYPTSDVEYEYVLEKDAYVLKEVNIDQYKQKKVYAFINGKYEYLGYYKKEFGGVILYQPADDRTKFVSDVNAKNPIQLPKGVTNIKVVYNGSSAVVDMPLVFRCTLNSTDAVKTKMSELNPLYFLTNGSLTVNDNSPVLKSDSLLIPKSMESSTKYSSVSKINPNKTIEEVQYNSVTYTDTIYEQIDYGTGSLDAAKENMKVVNGGTLYELLPKGAKLDGSVVVSTYGNKANVTNNVTQTENYKDTGRTLLKITIDKLADNFYTDKNILYSGYDVNFNIIYSQLDNQAFGNVLHKDMAYYNDGVLSNGFTNASEASLIDFTSKEVQDVMATLETENSKKNAVFKNVDTTLEKITVTVGTYNASVSTPTVMESKTYTYNLKYVFSSQYEVIKDLVFVDKLDSANTDNKYFKGVLESIDTSYLESLGVNPVIYYSTLDNIDLENVDLSDASTWSTLKPSNLKTITTIAISCGDYQFKGSQKVTPMVNITMRALNNFSSTIEKKAYNNSIINYNYLTDGVTKKMTSNTTEVLLKKATIEFTATTNVGSGSLENPAIVKDSLDYILKLSNTGSEDLEKVKFSVTIPKGVSVVAGDVTSKSNNSGNVTCVETSTGLDCSALSLKAGEVIDVTIPAKTSYKDLMNVGTFNTKMQFNSLGGYPYKTSEINVYNRLAVPEINYKKYVKTIDSKKFTDVSTSVVGKNETYEYKLVVNNISDLDANKITIVDKVPDGLTVNEASISNDGVYSSTDKTITWKVDVLASASLELTYSVTLSNDAVLGTIYRSSAHVTMVNPFDDTLMLYDDDTNVISVLYQIVSDIKISNKLSGALADKNKEFTYTFKFSGDSTLIGLYNVYKDDKEVDGLTINDGKGTYTTTLKGNENLVFKMLPSGISYEVSLKTCHGYESTVDGGSIVGDNLTIKGITTDEKLKSYEFTHNYDAKTSVELKASVKYNKPLLNGMFTVTIEDSDGIKKDVLNDESGKVAFNKIDYDNKVGVFTYKVYQSKKTLKKVLYDSEVYTVKVTVTDLKDGNLSTDIKYYNKANKEVDEMVFDNQYIPNGLVINNINDSLYVDPSIKFDYELKVENVTKGSYDILDNEGKKIDTLEVMDDGTATYQFSLKSNEKITINELSSGSKYSITMKKLPYYEVKSDKEFEVSEDKILVSGDFLDESVLINFTSTYNTKGTYNPILHVDFEGSEMVGNDFTFILEDVSNGISKGYLDVARNKIDGSINFKEITYNIPGEYKYVIKEVKGDSNHIYYDEKEAILTLTLVDNKDGTMKVTNVKYEYQNGNKYFMNKYSKEPIVVIKPDDKHDNPNTADGFGRYIVIAALAILIALLGFVYEHDRKRMLKY